MSIKTGQAILKCFIDLKSSVLVYVYVTFGVLFHLRCDV